MANQIWSTVEDAVKNLIIWEKRNAAAADLANLQEWEVIIGKNQSEKKNFDIDINSVFYSS